MSEFIADWQAYRSAFKPKNWGHAIILVICLLLLLAGVFSHCGCKRLIELNTDNSPVWVDNAPAWDHVPLKVDWSGLKNSAFDGSVKEAMKVWNRAVGKQLLVPAGNDKADVLLLPYEGSPCSNDFAAPLDSKAEAATFYCPDGTAEVQFRTLSDVVTAYLVATHEFGHVLGLAHNKRGIMAPVQVMSDPTAIGFRATLPPVIDPWSKHIKALKERYGK